MPHSNGERRFAVALILSIVAACGLEACLPIPYTEQLAPALTGTLRAADGAPMQGVAVAVSFDGRDSQCVAAKGRALTDSLGRFALPGIQQHHSWLLLMGDRVWSYHLCALEGDSGTVVYSWSSMHVPPTAQSLTCTVTRQQLAYTVCSESQ